MGYMGEFYKRTSNKTLKHNVGHLNHVSSTNSTKIITKSKSEWEGKCLVCYTVIIVPFINMLHSESITDITKSIITISKM